MLLPSAFRLVVRLALAAVVAVAAIPLSSSDADAGRRAVRAGIVGYKAVTRDRQSDEGASAAKSTSDAQPDTAAATATVTDAAPATKVASTKLNDDTVPGCAPGMICTVCIAGCGSSAIIIVHAERKLSRQK